MTTFRTSSCGSVDLRRRKCSRNGWSCHRGWRNPATLVQVGGPGADRPGRDVAVATIDAAARADRSAVRRERRGWPAGARRRGRGRGTGDGASAQGPLPLRAPGWRAASPKPPSSRSGRGRSHVSPRRCRCATRVVRWPRATPTPIVAPTGSTASFDRRRSGARGRPKIVLVGDLAFVHDAVPLTALATAAPTSGSWSSTTTAAGSSRSSRRRPQLAATDSSRCSARRTEPTSSRSLRHTGCRVTRCDTDRSWSTCSASLARGWHRPRPTAPTTCSFTGA